MATTIRSAELDFNTIKNSLKEYFQRQPEFADYNFEASGLSNLLDVLAYNTHQNALMANFALNESFLSTAQLRSSMVGLAGALGYTVRSRSASVAVLQLTTSSDPGIVPMGTAFTATVNNKTYTFRTRDVMTPVFTGVNYQMTIDGNANIPVYEGVPRSKNFISGTTGENDTYVIPETNLDIETVRVRVYDNTSTSVYDAYTNINEATNISSDSKIFVIKETPNGFYEISFGNGIITDQIPRPGNRVQVLYETVSGPEANGAVKFEDTSGLFSSLRTVSNSTSGSFKEGIESIRKNAPYLYAAQNRMVTAEDYSALIQRNYGTVIADIKSWGGEDNVPPEYGKVFVSILFETEDETVQDVTKGNITNLAKDLSVASFDVEFVDPNLTYLEVETFFQFNPYLTSSSETSIEAKVAETVRVYFDEQLGQFDQSFRRSNLLTRIDESDPSVLSSRAVVKMQHRFVPQSLIDSYTITFPTSISAPSDEIRTIKSKNFFLNGKVCFLQNRLDSTVIEVIDTATGKPEIDNVGYYDPAEGTLILSGFNSTLITGDFFKITAIPANQATINPTRNNILLFDGEESSATAIITDTV